MGGTLPARAAPLGGRQAANDFGGRERSFAEDQVEPLAGDPLRGTRQQLRQLLQALGAIALALGWLP